MICSGLQAREPSPIYILDSNNDFYSVINAQEGKFKPYYLAHIKAKTLALLDEKNKSSNWFQWRALLQPIRTLSEIKATIVIEPTKRTALYQILSRKVKQLHLLGMSYKSIAKSLNIDKATARKACNYKEE